MRIRLRRTTEDDLDFVFGAEQAAKNRVFVSLWTREQHGAAIKSEDLSPLTVENADGEPELSIWLPPYSPDFSPIELMWSKVKTYLKKVKARTQSDLEKAIAAALKTITTNDCRDWFRRCGYEVTIN